MTYRKPTLDDVMHVIREMRESDVRELTEHPHAGDRVLAETVRDSISVSKHAFVACHADVPFLMFGCAYSSKWVGTPWLFGTNDMTKHYREVIKTAPTWLRLFEESTGVLVNIFDTRNDTHIRWARLMGFVDDESVNINYRYMVRYRSCAYPH